MHLASAHSCRQVLTLSAASITTASADSDCVALWTIRQSNPRTPDYIFRGWRNVTGADHSCCFRNSSSPWLGVLCNDRLRVIELDLSSGNASAWHRISSIPATGFGKLTALTSLRLESIAIAQLPNVFSSLTSLHSFYMLNCSVLSLPDSFWTLPDLQFLWLSGANISFARIDRLCGSLRAFHCDQCGLRGLPDKFHNCSKLFQIELPNNPLNALPASLQSANIQYVKLDFTDITTLGPVCQMQGLVWLTASSCKQLRSVDCSFVGMRDLYYANFTDSALAVFRGFDQCAYETQTVGPCRGMRELSLGGNKV